MTAHHPLRGDVAVLIPAAGLGTRLGPGQPKALRSLHGESLLQHAVRRVGAAQGVGCIVVAAPAGEVVAVQASLGEDVIVVEGGATRQESVFAALSAAPPEFEVILVHDAARALAPSELIERVAQAVRDGHPVVIPVLPVVDTIKVVDESGFVARTVDRSHLRAVQTPQGFARAALAAAHAAAVDVATDDAGLAEAIGLKVFCVPGAAEATKITTAADLMLAELLLKHGS